jgi:WD40 repeat protein
MEDENNGTTTSITSSNTTNGDVLTVDKAGNVTQWNMEQDMASSVQTLEVSSDHKMEKAPLMARVQWDPHHMTQLAVTRRRSVHVLDLRQPQSDHHHGGGGTVDIGVLPSTSLDPTAILGYDVLDMDYNPNKPYVIATSHRNGLINVWDIRASSSLSSSSTASLYQYPSQPLLTCRGGHTHWTTTVKYNPFHDQLVLSTGTDAVCNLWRLSSISSAPLVLTGAGGGHGHGGGTSSSMDDGGVTSDHHNTTTNDITGGGNDDNNMANVHIDKYVHTGADACYGAAWGTAEAWIYLSVGYDGQAVLHHVPSDEKYKILL